jgi:SAM-dependent methyltransferase
VCGTVRSTQVGDPEVVYGEGYHDGEDGFFVDTDLPGLNDYLRRAYLHRLELIGEVASPPGRLLDVGCGRGDFLVSARDAGWDVTGVELVDSAARTARERHGFDVRAGRLDDAGLADGTFDVVCALHVVEHVMDAPAFLRQLAALTRPGGHVVVEVPNFASLLRRVQRGSWKHLRPREHVSHFTASTLFDALRRGGLRPVALSSPSYTGAAVEIGQGLSDVGLRWLAGPATRVDRIPALSPWARRALRATERALSRTRLGVVLLAVAEVS